MTAFRGSLRLELDLCRQPDSIMARRLAALRRLWGVLPETGEWLERHCRVELPPALPLRLMAESTWLLQGSRLEPRSFSLLLTPRPLLRSLQSIEMMV